MRQTFGFVQEVGRLNSTGAPEKSGQESLKRNSVLFSVSVDLSLLLLLNSALSSQEHQRGRRTQRG